MKKAIGNKEKEKFRRTKEWKNFRKKLILERGQICQNCGKNTKLLHCHHADESVENYQNLNPDNFYLLCSLCHKCVSDLEHIKPENREKLRSPEWNNMFGKYLK